MKRDPFSRKDGDYKMRFDEHFLRGVIPEAIVEGEPFPDDAHFSIDTRTLKKGDVFIALSGAHNDGHDFLNDALLNGARGLIIAADKRERLNSLDKKLLKVVAIASVPDVMLALLKLASAWRAQFAYPVVAITGSVGKSTTKEILANVLRLNKTEHMVSHANQNTQIGVALNILRLRSHHQVGIFEVGISTRGEMAKIADLLRPTTALITNIGHSHMEGLGSLADIALEKRDIFKYFTEESIGIINGDQSVLADVGYIHPVIKFGAKTINQIQARKINVSGDHISFVLKIYRQKFPILLKNTHTGRVFNALAAAAAAQLLKVPSAVIAQGIALPVEIPGRFEHRVLKAIPGQLINDCYNANPESMKASLLAFGTIETKYQKIAVLGDMLELGVNSPFWHRQLGRFLRKVPSVKHVILVGNMVKWTKKTLPVGVTAELVPDWKEAEKRLKQRISTDPSLVLVKGSHGMKLSKLVDQIAG